MNWIDFILNCACLLLWLNWRSQRLALIERAPGIALIGTLKRAGGKPRENWTSPILLAAILVIRAFIYWEAGPSAHWMPRISLAAIVLHFRSDMFTRMFLFSLLNFLAWLAAFYFSLLLVVAVNRQTTSADPWNALVRAHLGILGRFPAWLNLLLPFVFTFLLWLMLAPPLASMKIHLPVNSFQQLCAQAAIIGLSGWLVWPFIITVVLVLHVVSSYVYFGNAPFWIFINNTARGLLRPLAWLPLRAGKIDFAPLLVLALMITIILFAPGGLAKLYTKFVS